MNCEEIICPVIITLVITNSATSAFIFLPYPICWYFVLNAHAAKANQKNSTWAEENTLFIKMFPGKKNRIKYKSKYNRVATKSSRQNSMTFP